MSQRNRLRNRAQYSTFSILFAAVVSVELHSCRNASPKDLPQRVQASIHSILLPWGHP